MEQNCRHGQFQVLFKKIGEDGVTVRVSDENMILRCLKKKKPVRILATSELRTNFVRAHTGLRGSNKGTASRVWTRYPVGSSPIEHSARIRWANKT